jgi:hypothetical protein
MAKAYENTDRAIGFHDEDEPSAWMRIGFEEDEPGLAYVDSYMAPPLTIDNLRALRDWIDARLAELAAQHARNAGGGRDE